MRTVRYHAAPVPSSFHNSRRPCCSLQPSPNPNPEPPHRINTYCTVLTRCSLDSGSRMIQCRERQHEHPTKHMLVDLFPTGLEVPFRLIMVMSGTVKYPWLGGGHGARGFTLADTTRRDTGCCQRLLCRQGPFVESTSSSSSLSSLRTVRCCNRFGRVRGDFFPYFIFSTLGRSKVTSVGRSHFFPDRS